MAGRDSASCSSGTDLGTDRLDYAVVKLMQLDDDSCQASMLTVYLAYAETATRQHYLTLQVKPRTTIYEALAQAGWLTQFTDLALWCEQVADTAVPATKLWHVGIYAKKQPLHYQLQQLDRIEVYRSLSADPMSQRKSKVAARK